MDSNIEAAARFAGMGVVDNRMRCSYCGSTEAVQLDTVRKLSVAVVVVPVCINVRSCSERMAQQVKDKALSQAKKDSPYVAEAPFDYKKHFDIRA